MITSFTDHVAGVGKMGGWRLHFPAFDGLKPSFTDISLPVDEVPAAARMRPRLPMGMAIAMIVVMGEGEIVGIEYDPFQGVHAVAERMR